MKTKKSTLLSLATAAAIVATTFGTYAVWDTTKDSASANLTLRKPVVVTAELSENGFAATNEAFGETPSYTSDVTFTVTNLDQVTDGKITLETAVKKSDGTPVTSDFDIVYTEAAGETGLTDRVDSSITASNQYTVKITPKDTDAAKALADDNALTVEVTGTLSK